MTSPRIRTRVLAAVLPLIASCSGAVHPAPDGLTCPITALGHGRDDASRFASTVKSPFCQTIEIPEHTTLNISTKMDLTGLKNKHISLKGTIKFNPDIDYWVVNGFPFTFQTQISYWLLGGENILLDGGGTLDGSGQPWYDAFATNSTLLRPILLTIFEGTDVTVKNINLINSPEWTNLVHTSKRVTYANVNISAVSTSKNSAKNTDGWDTYRSDQVVIRDSIINNGDDCVSFKPNSTNILVSNLQCNGSHGISVGSLGQFPGVFDIVENVTSTNVRMSNAQNGARIKCWAGPGVGGGIVRNITFEHFVESNVDNPLIIDQCYMTNASACSEFPSNTFIQDIIFTDISGTSSGNEGGVVASIGCSPGVRCSNITVDDISLTSPKGNTSYTCQNIALEGDSAALFGTCAST